MTQRSTQGGTPDVTRRGALAGAGALAVVAATAPQGARAAAPGGLRISGALTADHPAGGQVSLFPEENRLARWDARGRTVFEHRGEGASPEALNRPRGLAVAPNGDILVANTGGGALLRSGPGGALLAVAAGLRGPRSVAVGPDARVYVAETSRRRVLAFDAALSASAPVLTDADGLRGPTAVAVAPDGTLAVVEQHGARLLILAPGARALRITQLAETPRAVAFEVDGTLLLALGDDVHRVAPDGRLLGTLALGGPVRHLVAGPGGQLGLQLDGTPA